MTRKLTAFENAGNDIPTQATEEFVMNPEPADSGGPEAGAISLQGASVGFFSAHGIYVRTIQGDASLNPGSRCFASITQVNAAGTPTWGGPTMHVSNVVPRNGEAIVVGHIQWNTPLPVRVSLFWI
ncbi:hypothetical protein RFN58_12505 [Streptomyces iakyrus]|uniref:hypothetical protein n=1 Tax=Streptomyces iakyrus TaxID=68219 RepID=UPI0012FECAC6|nr:hypothetical protein [Streptomyces iakyrus]